MFDWLLFLNPTWIISHLVEIAVREFIEEHVAQVNEPAPWEAFDSKQNARLLRHALRNRLQLQRIRFHLAEHSFFLGDPPGRFKLSIVNNVLHLYGAESIDDYFSEDAFTMFDSLGYETMISQPLPDIFGWEPSYMRLFNRLAYPPHLVAGMVLWQLRRLRTLSMLVDAYHPEVFRGFHRT